MTEEIHVSDDIKPFLDDISERLWSGHAAIMVGAGFSKNAEPVNGSKNTFPSWAELGDIFYEKVNGGKPKTGDKYLNALKLADEVSAAFGRPTLN
ncbi:MAG: SIR2 family protein, partial [Alphaproteobacteria bacterium]|nr:SIR2 family protein [Alphaproteobacteria bacterium]